jgi:hypothetical protein
MFNKNVPVEFIAPYSENDSVLELLEKPIPANQNLPDWYRFMSGYVNTKKEVDKDSNPTSTVKKCMPVMDMITAGYLIPLHTDVWIEQTPENEIKCQWATPNFISLSYQSPDQYVGYPIPEGYHKQVYKWINQWIVKTPPGWSTIFLHPQHREDLPFRSLSAIVDTDKFPTPVNLPFFFKKGFEGLIAKGTPMIQIIPFKRENFESYVSYDKDKKYSTLWQKARSEFFERYQKFFRTPKSFKSNDFEKPKCPFGFGG